MAGAGYWRCAVAARPVRRESATLPYSSSALVGPVVTADRATSLGLPNDAVGSGPILIRTTVQKVVTYREKGKVIGR